VPYPFDILNGILNSYPSNWHLKSRVRLYINETLLKRPDQLKPEEKSAVSLHSSPSKDFKMEEDPSIDEGILMRDWE